MSCCRHVLCCQPVCSYLLVCDSGIRVSEAGTNVMLCLPGAAPVSQCLQLVGGLVWLLKRQKAQKLLINCLCGLCEGSACTSAAFNITVTSRVRICVSFKVVLPPILKLSLIPFVVWSTLSEPSRLHLLAAPPCSHCAVNSLLLLGSSSCICIHNFVIFSLTLWCT